MDTTGERMMILKMIEAGTVSADEGARLLASVGEEKVKPRTAAAATIQAKGGPKWFRVKVTNIQTGKNKATVSLPLTLMDWGLKVGAHFAPEMEGLDLEELSVLLREGAEGKIVDVLDEEDGEHVEIYIE